jgi:hypothetical protein
MARDEITARRWFRRKLETIAKTYPELKDPDRQAACDDWLQEEECIERDKASEGERQAQGDRPI